MEINEAFRTPSRVSLPLIPRSTSRLSSRYSEPSRPSCVTRRKLSWITLQGRLVGVDGATSAKAVGMGLSRDETVAWELFSPLHRVLLVALVAAATAKSRASQKIKELKRLVDLRDRALEAMQLKLDSLCEEMISIQDTVGCKLEKTEMQHDGSLTNLVEQEERCMSDFCWSVASSSDNQTPRNSLASEQEVYNLQKECKEKDATIKELLSAAEESRIKRSIDLRDRALEAMQLKLDSLCEEMISIQDTVGCKLEKTVMQHDGSLTNLVEQEERRMSDFCWSVASSSDNQTPLSSLASEQEVHNLQKECEEKHATIKELLSAAEESRIADTTRITQLEELVRRKNLMISKLKKDIAVLERIVIDLTRSRRASSALSLDSNKEEIPVMVNNILFDITSSSSSSESESPFASKEHPFEGLVGLAHNQEPVVTEKQKSRQMLSKKVEASTENHTKKKTDIMGAVRTRQRQRAAFSESFKRTRRSTQQQQEPKSIAQRRWL